MLGGYVPDIDYFFTVNFLAERSSVGGFLPIIYDVTIFRPRLSWNNFWILLFDWILYILGIVLGFVYIKELIFKLKKQKNFNYLKKALPILVFVFVCLKFMYAILAFLGFARVKTEDWILSGKFYDLRDSASRFHLLLRTKSLCACLNILILLVFLSQKITKQSALKVINQLAIRNVKYFIFVWISLICGFALVGNLLFGSYNYSFSSFARSFKSTEIVSFGKLCKFLYKKDVGDELEFSEKTSFVYWSCCFFMAQMLTFTVFLAYGFLTYHEVNSEIGFYAPSLKSGTFRGKIILIEIWLLFLAFI